MQTIIKKGEGLRRGETGAGEVEVPGTKGAAGGTEGGGGGGGEDEVMEGGEEGEEVGEEAGREEQMRMMMETSEWRGKDGEQDVSNMCNEPLFLSSLSSLSLPLATLLLSIYPYFSSQFVFTCTCI